MTDEMVSLQAGVTVISLCQLEEAFAMSSEESVFAWLRSILETKPLLLTNDRGLVYRRAVTP